MYLQGSGLAGYWLFSNGSAQELDTRAAQFNSYPIRHLFMLGTKPNPLSGFWLRYPTAIEYWRQIPWIEINLMDEPWSLPSHASRAEFSTDCELAMLYVWSEEDTRLRPILPAISAPSRQAAWTFYSRSRAHLVAGTVLGNGGGTSRFELDLYTKSTGGKHLQVAVVASGVAPNTHYYHCRLDLLGYSR